MFYSVAWPTPREARTLTSLWPSQYAPQAGLKAVVLPIQVAPLQAELAFVHAPCTIPYLQLSNGIVEYLPSYDLFPGNLLPAAARSPPTVLRSQPPIVDRLESLSRGPLIL